VLNELTCDHDIERSSRQDFTDVPRNVGLDHVVSGSTHHFHARRLVVHPDDLGCDRGQLSVQLPGRMHTVTDAAEIENSLPETEIYEHCVARTLLDDEGALKDDVSMRLGGSAEWIVSDVTPTHLARA
jgi:hypothetical protein